MLTTYLHSFIPDLKPIIAIILASTVSPISTIYVREMMHRYVTRECIFKVVTVSKTQLESGSKLCGSKELISPGRRINYSTYKISVCFVNFDERTTDPLREKYLRVSPSSSTYHIMRCDLAKLKTNVTLGNILYANRCFFLSNQNCKIPKKSITTRPNYLLYVGALMNRAGPNSSSWKPTSARNLTGKPISNRARASRLVILQPSSSATRHRIGTQGNTG